MRSRNAVVARCIASVVVTVLGLSSCSDLGPDAVRPLAGITVRSLETDERLALDVGDRPVIVNLWAPWCVPCRTELPVIDGFAREHPEVLVVGVAARGDRREAADFARAVGVTFSMAVDDTGAVFRSLEVSGLPVTAFVRTDGTVASVHRGRVGVDDLTAGVADVGPRPVTGRRAAAPAGM